MVVRSCGFRSGGIEVDVELGVKDETGARPVNGSDGRYEVTADAAEVMYDVMVVSREDRRGSL